MKVHIVSDLHITSPSDPLYDSLLELMGRAKSGEQIVLAGDIFDFFVERQPKTIASYSRFFELLKRLGERGVKIAYIEGNHDFHLSRAFEGVSGLSVFPAELTVSLPSKEGGMKRLYVAHGDLADPTDRGYLLLRALLRSPWIRFLARILPETMVHWIGNGSSLASRKVNPRLPEEYGPENLERIRGIYRGFAEKKFNEGFDAIVLGHCHDLDQDTFLASGRSGAYMNVGFPRKHGSYVLYSAEEGLQRVELFRSS